MAERGRDLEQRTLASNLRFWAKRDRRCLKNNRYYHRVRSAVAAGQVVNDLNDAVLAELLCDPDEPFRRPGVTLLKDSRSSTVAEFDWPVNGVLRRVIYKRFRVVAQRSPGGIASTHAGAPVVGQRPGSAGTSPADAASPGRLAPPPSWPVLRGLPAHREGPRCRRTGPFRRRPGGFWLPRSTGRLCAVSSIRRPTWCGVLHERRLSHRDLKAANILVQSPSTSPERQRRDPVAGAPGMCDDSIDQEHLWLIDLVGVGRHRRLSQRRRIQNLARLNASFHGSATVTRTDRLRFLRVYLGWGLFGKQGWKKWWREIGATTRAKVERNAQRGRPLA